MVRKQLSTTEGLGNPGMEKRITARIFDIIADAFPDLKNLRKQYEIKGANKPVLFEPLEDGRLEIYLQAPTGGSPDGLRRQRMTHAEQVLGMIVGAGRGKHPDGCGPVPMSGASATFRNLTDLLYCLEASAPYIDRTPSMSGKKRDIPPALASNEDIMAYQIEREPERKIMHRVVALSKQHGGAMEEAEFQRNGNYANLWEWASVRDVLWLNTGKDGAVTLRVTVTYTGNEAGMSAKCEQNAAFFNVMRGVALAGRKGLSKDPSVARDDRSASITFGSMDDLSHTLDAMEKTAQRSGSMVKKHTARGKGAGSSRAGA